VTDSRVVPEVIGKDFNVSNVSAALNSLIEHPTGQLAAMHQTMDALGRGGEDPGLRAARAVMAGLS
jgi:lipid-A-disaccharide synthase